MAAEYYIAHNTRTDEYLAEKKIFGRFYMTPDITAATKCKDEMELRRKIEKANVDYKSQLVIETIKVY
ncbi:MAG: hypothetical protein K5776_01340 [Lachnospiraceae bacterium]|nr:hypothetical protein [Lachnospiraceae bacterium]